MSFVLGVDQSVRHTGVCVLDYAGNVRTLCLIEPPKQLEGSRHLVFIRDTLNSILTQTQISVAVMEGYSFNSVNKKFLLGEVGATVKLCIYDTKAVLYDAAPTQLKKFVTGRGDADKAKVITHLKALYGVEIDDDNLADAYGLAQIALQLHNTNTNKRYQLEVLKQLKSKSLCSKNTRSKVRASPFSI